MLTTVATPTQYPETKFPLKLFGWCRHCSTNSLLIASSQLALLSLSLFLSSGLWAGEVPSLSLSQTAATVLALIAQVHRASERPRHLRAKLSVVFFLELCTQPLKAKRMFLGNPRLTFGEEAVKAGKNHQHGSTCLLASF